MNRRQSTVLLGLILGAAVLFIGGVGQCLAEAKTPAEAAGMVGKSRDAERVKKMRETQKKIIDAQKKKAAEGSAAREAAKSASPQTQGGTK